MQCITQILSHNIFNIIHACSKELHIESYVVGGYVRDYFLNRESKDIDIVTIGSGIALAKKQPKKSVYPKKILPYLKIMVQRCFITKVLILSLLAPVKNLM